MLGAADGGADRRCCVDNQGGCEKIRRTPLPFVYAALIKQVLLLYLATLPFVLVPKMGFVAPLVVVGVSLGMLGIEEAGVEIEDPFGLDPNHLPLDEICDDDRPRRDRPGADNRA